MGGDESSTRAMTFSDRLRTAGLRGARRAPPVVRRVLRGGATWVGETLAAATAPGAGALDRLRAPVIGPSPPLPPGTKPERLRALLGTLAIDDESSGHLDEYATESWLRLLHTWGLVSEASGRGLELGANPYFLTTLLDRYTALDLQLANFFASPHENTTTQTVSVTADGARERRSYTSDLFNMEEESFPYDDDSFDVVLFCEILEHLLIDPVRALQEINRVLKPGGQLVLTTPNAARRANVVALVAGINIYDPYSAHGPYGRHNREYTPHELNQLLRFCGFTPDTMFTADSSAWEPPTVDGVSEALRLVGWREPDLGQYIFSSSRSTSSPRRGRPDFLFRGLPASETIRLA
jgi:SAM-dependent methyltransferase